MKIAIFSISLGKYDIFFNEFYESINHFFLPNHEKNFYLFSDKELESKNNLFLFKQEKLGWPYDTMMRFHFINKIKNILAENDFIYFFNINMKALSYINENVIPTEKNDFLVGCEHPLINKDNINNYPYERNNLSNFYIPYNQGKIYYQGCFNGGRIEEFLKMSENLENNLDNDLKNNIIPIWHDESALNWFFSKKNPLTLDYSYIYPESYDLPKEKIMIQRNKWKYMEQKELRS
jgi:hypothetical protein